MSTVLEFRIVLISKIAYTGTMKYANIFDLVRFFFNSAVLIIFGIETEKCFRHYGLYVINLE